MVKGKQIKRKRKKKGKIDKYDAQLFGSLYKAKRPLPIKRLAKRTDMSWQTANTHLKKLKRLNIVNIQKTKRRTNITINPIFLTRVKKKKKSR